MTITLERLTAEIEADPSKALKGLDTLNNALDAAAKDRKGRVDIDFGGAERAANAVNGSIKTLAGGMKDLVGGAAAVGSGMGGAGGGIKTLGGAAGGAGGPLRMMGVNLAAMAVQAVAVGAVIPYIVSAMNALGGAAFAVTSALGPLTGLLGTLPVLGAAAAGGIAALILGLKGVGEAYKLQDRVSKEAIESGRTAASRARERAAAERSLEQAVTSVTRAQQALKDAEAAVSEARVQAAKDIRESRRDVLDAVSSEEEAIEAVARAQENLRRAQQRTNKSTTTLTKMTDEFTGKIYEVAQVSADATDSADNLRDAQRSLTRAERDRQRAAERVIEAKEKEAELTKKGINQSDLVIRAQRNLRDSQYALKNSIDGVAAAQSRLAEAMERASGRGTAAQRQLAEAMAKLTPAGRSLVMFIRDELAPEWKKLQDAAQEGLLGGSQGQIKHIETGLRSLMTFMPTLTERMRDFGTTVGSAFADFSAGITTVERKDQLNRVLVSANKVLKDVLAGFSQIGYTILTIADEARPLTEWMATGFKDAMTDLREKTDKWAKDGTLKRFFLDTKQVVKDVLDIIGNVAIALFNIGRESAPTGNSLLGSIKDTTAAWRKWTEDDTNREKVRKWFKDIEKPVREIGRFFASFAKEFLTIGRDGGPVMENFSVVVSDLREALPGVKDVLQDISTIIGPIATGVEAIAKAYTKISDAMGFIIKTENTLNDLLGLHAGDQRTDAEKTADKILEEALRAQEAWKKTGSSNVRQAERHEKAVRDAMDRVKREEKTASDSVFFSWSDVTTRIKTSWNALDTWWRLDKNSAPGKIRTWLKDVWTDAGKWASRYIEDMKEEWRGFTKWLKNLNPFGDGPGKTATSAVKAPSRGSGTSATGGAGSSSTNVDRGGSTGGSGMGSAAQMAGSAIMATGGTVTSGYRNPKQNAAVGGSPGSYHTDAANPAQDIVSPNMKRTFDYLAANFGGSIREMIYGNRIMKRGKVSAYTKNDHWDHVHVAHNGGDVSSSWPSMPGLRNDERPAILQVGERVVPKSENNGGGGLTDAQLERVLAKVMANAKAPVMIDQTFNEKADPRLISSELAWRLS